jgi:hypothetical protein
VKFCCELGGDRFTLEHDTANAAAKLQVPQPASLEVDAVGGWPQPADRRDQVAVLATCLDGRWQPFRHHPKYDRKAMTLLPGRWRLELIEESRVDPHQAVIERKLGMTAEVVLRAGDAAAVTLR